MQPSRDLPRRRFVGHLLVAPTLVAAARLGVDLLSAPSAAAEDGPPAVLQPSTVYDLNDLLTDAARPTSHLISVQVDADGMALFALPRAEVGQGITTAAAMLIAEELDLPLAKVHVTLADARPELMWNQLTGGSNTLHAMYEPIRLAAATAREQLKRTAAVRWGVPVATLTTGDGMVHGSGRSASYGSLAAAAAVVETTAIDVELKPATKFSLVGKPQNRVDAHLAVTGRKVFAMDITIPGLQPAMVCRPPTITGRPKAVHNLDAVKAMPGISHVVVIPTGVAVVGSAFGLCIDAINALDVDWEPGPMAGKSTSDVVELLKQAELPLTPPPPGAKTLEEVFTFHFRSGGALETNCAVADVRPDSAEIWSSLKMPIVSGQEIAKELGLPPEKVTTHVTEGGGSFGRHLFFDAALEAAQVSKTIGAPVKLMWHRTDDFRHGRAHPMCTSRVRITYQGDRVLAYDQRHTSLSTDFTTGLGEIATAEVSKLPGQNFVQYSQAVFYLSAMCPYDFGVADHALNEIDLGIPSSSVRNIYSPELCTARELMVDQLAVAMGKDPYELRRRSVKDDRSKTVLETVARVGRWSRPMAPGTAQGIAFHQEYKGHCACLVEIDCRPETVNRRIHNAWTGPRVTRMVLAVDVGRPVNPRGVEAQMLGGMMDGVAQALTYMLHLEDGAYLEASWDNAFYTRQWNVPPDVQVIVMPATSDEPGGAGEFGVAASMAAVACAYSRAVGKLQTFFPVKADQALGFDPFPTHPPLPTYKSKKKTQDA
ncbi:MAG TPA: molybdopterin cofactor-binding domain-containing protein [Sporichthyaceae bacterium]|nr:molybdopterin cofactor-binding domain-containing protein [Sporichthyaceae bacterium]